MAGIADDFRKHAKELDDASVPLISAADFGTSKPKEFASAIIGKVTANFYTALADMMDFTRLSTGLDETTQRRMKILATNDAIRRAAAKGDWDEFDKLSAGLGSDDDGPANNAPAK